MAALKQAGNEMKIFWLGIIALVLVMGIGTSVYAAGNEDGQGWFENMLPYAKQMHPDLTDSQVKDMVNHCRSKQGTNTSGMMNF